MWGGKPAEIIEAAEQRKVSILISEDILAEINHLVENQLTALRGSHKEPAGYSNLSIIQKVF